MKLDKPCEDQAFLAMLGDYERELHAVDAAYPTGRTVSFLDVEGFHTYVALEGDGYLGFIVLGIEGDESEIHEFYVKPEHRNGAVARALLEAAFASGSKLIFNIFKKNKRVQAFAEHVLRQRCVQVARGEREVWGAHCIHYETKPNRLLQATP